VRLHRKDSGTHRRNQKSGQSQEVRECGHLGLCGSLSVRSDGQGGEGREGVFQRGAFPRIPGKADRTREQSSDGLLRSFMYWVEVVSVRSPITRSPHTRSEHSASGTGRAFPLGRRETFGIKIPGEW